MTGRCGLAEMLEAKASGLRCTIVSGEHAGEHFLWEEGSGLPEGSLPAARDLANVRKTAVLPLPDGGELFCERAGSGRSAVICGAGHVALEVVAVLRRLDYEITVIEDRLSFADAARAAGCDRVMVGAFREQLQAIPADPGLAYIVMTRGHRFDVECLDVILRREFLYAGMMSSRMRVGAVKEQLLRDGIAEERLSRLHAPIGLSIGATTPAEIAISVAAELISEAGSRKGAETREIPDALREAGEKVLCTIISRRGPAPRKPGTRMVVFADGRLAGTVGGGCFEAEVVQAARRMLTCGQKTDRMEVDLRPDADGDGMACGGVMSVFLERCT